MAFNAAGSACLLPLCSGSQKLCKVRIFVINLIKNHKRSEIFSSSKKRAKFKQVLISIWQATQLMLCLFDCLQCLGFSEPIES